MNRNNNNRGYRTLSWIAIGWFSSLLFVTDARACGDYGGFLPVRQPGIRIAVSEDAKLTRPRTEKESKRSAPIVGAESTSKMNTRKAQTIFESNALWLALIAVTLVALTSSLIARYKPLY